MFLYITSRFIWNWHIQLKYESNTLKLWHNYGKIVFETSSTQRGASTKKENKQSLQCIKKLPIYKTDNVTHAVSYSKSLPSSLL